MTPAEASCTVIGYSVTYDGEPHTATGTCTGVEGESLSGLDLSATTHTSAGTYNGDAWTFTDVTGNYNNANGMVDDSITQATLTVKADDKTKLLNAFNPAFTFQITGFKNGESTAVLTTQPTCTSVATETSSGRQVCDHLLGRCVRQLQLHLCQWDAHDHL